ncbi:MAG: hypothetical protein QRY71_02465 [Candidatus Rhabdochlamydia sp.]
MHSKHVFSLVLLALFLMRGVQGEASFLSFPLDVEKREITEEAPLWVFPSPAELISCRWVMQDLVSGEPEVKSLDCPKNSFLRDFLLLRDECIGALVEGGKRLTGCIIVGKVAPQIVMYQLRMYHQFLTEYGSQPLRKGGTFTFIQAPSSHLRLVYKMPHLQLEEVDDLKKIWTHALIQLMATYRMRDQIQDAFPRYLQSQELDYLLPVNGLTLSFTAEHFKELRSQEGPFMKSLKTLHHMKSEGFKEIELTNAVWRLKKKLKKYSAPLLSTQKSANYWIPFLIHNLPQVSPSSLIPLSLKLLTQITLQDVSHEMNGWFKDDLRIVQLQSEDNRDASELKQLFRHHSLDKTVCQPREFTQEPILDPFSELILTAEEEEMLLYVIQKVAKTHPIQLGLMIRDLEKKRVQLMHIHPLKSMAFFLSTPHTVKCLEEILESLFKAPSFIGDFSKRMKQELGSNQLFSYVPGFCEVVRASPARVYAYIQMGDFEGLIYYLIDVKKEA